MLSIWSEVIGTVKSAARWSILLTDQSVFVFFFLNSPGLGKWEVQKKSLRGKLRHKRLQGVQHPS